MTRIAKPQRLPRRVLVSLIGMATWMGYAAAAHAAPTTTVALEYDAGQDEGACPDAGEFRAGVRRQLGYDPFRDTAERRVAVQIARTEFGFEGWIRWTDARGRWVGDRRLSSRRPECSDIAASVVFAVAVQIQLLAALEPGAPEPSASHAAPVTPETGTSTPNANATSPDQAQAAAKPGAAAHEAGTSAAPSSPSASPRAARAQGLRISAGLGPALAFDIAPKPTGLGRIFVSGRLAWFSLELGADAALPTTHRRPDGSGFSLHRFAAGAAACGHVDAFGACLVATLGRLEADGVGVDKPASPAGLFSQLGGRIAVRHEFGDRYFVGARAEALVMLASWAVTLNDTVAWTTPRVGGLLGLDLGVIFF